jgi:hypothetical protein
VTVITLSAIYLVMGHIEGYDHQDGVHCGAAAIRNVSRFYGWHDTEAGAFGIGGGPAFVRYTDPESQWRRFRTSPIWLERAFFERAGIPHLFREGDDFEMAWANVATRVDDGDPVLLFLDPADLPYLPEEPHHLPPHTVVLIGYDEHSVVLSDAAVDTRQEISRETLADAWTVDRFLEMRHEYLIVTRSAKTNDGTDAAAAGLRQAATYMLDPLEIKRNARGPGDEGLVAMRAFADSIPRWAEDPASREPVRNAKRTIDEHGDETAYRRLFAESIEELGQRTGLAPDLAGRMNRVADDWGQVKSRFDAILEQKGSRPETYQEAASLVGSIADREEEVLEALAEQLGPVEDRP